MATAVLCSATVAMVLGGVEPAAAAPITRYVATTGDDQGGANDCAVEGSPCRTIGHAVAQAVGGDTVQIGGGSYPENLTVDKNLTLARDPGASELARIDGNGSDVITVSSGVSATLRRLFVTNGRHGVNNAGSLTIDEGTYDSNAGSGVFSTGSVTATGVLFRRNGAGSGVLMTGSRSATVADSTFSENLVGVGAQDDVNVQVFSSTFDENGFGFFSSSSLPSILAISTVVESNIGVWTGSTGDIIVLGSTMSRNTTGIRNEATTMVAGSIVAGNGTDCAESAVIDGNFNIGGDNSCAFGNINSVDGTDPLLQASLTDNGGPTETLAPKSTSPAVDVIPVNAGIVHSGLHLPLCSNAATSKDQRGQPRLVGDGCDVGSVELAESSTALTSSAVPAASERTFTATVTGKDGLPDPDGTVSFNVTGSPASGCADVPVTDGEAACLVTGIADGTEVTATYIGTNGYRTSAATSTFDPPETTIESGPSGTVDTGSASFTYSSSEAGSSFECRLDDGDFEACPAGGRDYTGLPDGEHTFQVRATDADGHTDPTPASRTWTVDTVPPPDTEAPETTIESGPSGTVDIGSASFTYSSSESGSTFECRLDDGDFESCPADGQNYTGLADGEHTFQVRATDAGDNTDDSPASRTWTIDSTPPGGDDDGDGDGSGDGDESDDDSDGDQGSDRGDDSSGLLPDTGGLPLALAVLALLLLPLGAVTTWAGRRRAAVSRHHGRSDHVEP